MEYRLADRDEKDIEIYFVIQKWYEAVIRTTDEEVRNSKAEKKDKLSDKTKRIFLNGIRNWK